MVRGLALAGVVALTEATARHFTRSRARGWLWAYIPLGVVALAIGGSRLNVARPGAVPRPGAIPRRKGSRHLAVGILLAVAGYPVGRLLLGDRPVAPPPDPMALELLTLGAVVAVAEELWWGGLVETELGLAPSAALFALKHPLIDHRWRRLLGLFLFSGGVGLVRVRSRPAAAALHIAANAAGVVLGHTSGRDQF